jgi:hypothetical protein
VEKYSLADIRKVIKALINKLVSAINEPQGQSDVKTANNISENKFLSD